MENAQFCAFCGCVVEKPAPTPKFCRKCGKPLEEGAAFCVFCGTKVEEIPEPRQVPAPPPVAQPVAPPAAPPVIRHAAPPPPPVVPPAVSYTPQPVPVPQKPKRKKKKGLIVALVLLLLVAVGGLGLFLGLGLGQGQGQGQSGGSAEVPRGPIPVTLRVAVEANEAEWINDRIEAFRAAYPEYDLSVEIQYIKTEDAADTFASDPANAPDVFMYYSEDVNIMAEAGLLAPLDGVYLETVTRDNADSMVDSFRAADGNVYGFPYLANTWFLYYDKSVFTEEDVKSLETMLSKGGVSFPVNNSWYLGGFYAAGGATFFGQDGIDADAGIRLNNGEAVTKYLIDLMQHRNFYLDDSQNGQVLINGLNNGKVAAFFSGFWMENQVREIWGDNMAVAPLPTIRLNGETCQLQAFVNGQGIGVNAMAENREVAMEFAAFLVSEESQLARYQMCDVKPAHLGLMDHPSLAGAPVAVGSLRSLADSSIVMPTITQMQCYWTPMNELGRMIVNGQVNAANASSVIRETERKINGG